nr:hypothetical protein [uncultured Tolumonas sp.]
MGMYEQLVAIGYMVHTGHDGWWLGRDFELWLLHEQRRIYGEHAISTPEIKSALVILTQQQTSAA